WRWNQKQNCRLGCYRWCHCRFSNNIDNYLCNNLHLQKIKKRKQSPYSSDHLETPLENRRFDTQEPSKLSLTGPADTHYDMPISNMPVPDVRAENHYDHVPTPMTYTAHSKKEQYDNQMSPLPIYSHSEEDNFDFPKAPVHVYSNLGEEGNYDCKNTPVSVNSNLCEESIYDYPKSPIPIHSIEEN
ncbi:unnamed protein product, partial [Meganyctiphanes norvegica]